MNFGVGRRPLPYTIGIPKGFADVPQRSVRPYLWMLAGCGSFSIMTVLAHAAGERCNWQTVAFFRAFLVLLFVGVYAVATGTKLVFLRPRKLWIRSISGSLSLVMTFYALSKLKASTVVTLSNTFPIWVALLSWPILGVWPSSRVWPAVICGVAGVYLIQMPNGGTNHFAILLALTGAATTSIAMIGLHKLRGVNPNAVVVHFSAVATVASSTAFFLFERHETHHAVLLSGCNRLVAWRRADREHRPDVSDAGVCRRGSGQSFGRWLVASHLYTFDRLDVHRSSPDKSDSGRYTAHSCPNGLGDDRAPPQETTVPELAAPTTDIALAADPAEHDGEAELNS